MSVEGLVGEQAVVALQDRGLMTVRLTVQPRGTQVTKEQIIRRGVGKLPSPVVSEWLVATAKGDLRQATQLLQNGKVEEREIEKGLRLVARNYPQAYSDWMHAIERHVPLTVSVIESLMWGYMSQRAWEKVVELYETQQKDRWGILALETLDAEETLGLDVYANHRIEWLYVEALWQLGNRDSAIEHVRLVQPWYASKDLEALVGMASKEPMITWSDKPPVASDLKGQDVLGKDWTVADKDWTVLAFWATWCAPCQKELPELSAWAASVEGVNVLAVNLNDGFENEDVSKAITKMGLQNGSLRGVKDPSLATLFDIEALPTLVLLDKQGIERYRMVGYSPTSIAEMERRMDGATTPRVPIAKSQRTHVEWYPKPGLKDIQWQDGTGWALQENRVGKILDWSCWLKDEDTEHCYEESIVSENVALDRIFVYENGLATLSHDQKLIEFTLGTKQTQADKQGMDKTTVRWSFGESLTGWELDEDASTLWTWGQHTVVAFDVFTGEKVWFFEVNEQDLVQSLQPYFRIQNSSFSEEGFQRQTADIEGALLLTESKILTIQNREIVREQPLSDTLSSAKGLSETHLLGPFVPDALSAQGVTWVHRQHRGRHSFVALLDKSSQSLVSGGITSKQAKSPAAIEVVELVDEMDSIKGIKGIRLFKVGNSSSVWVLIPNQGLLHLSPNLSNPPSPSSIH